MVIKKNAITLQTEMIGVTPQLCFHMQPYDNCRKHNHNVFANQLKTEESKLHYKILKECNKSVCQKEYLFSKFSRSSEAWLNFWG